jgi:hypothetical protein
MRVLPGPKRIKPLEDLEFLVGFQAGRFHRAIVAVNRVSTSGERPDCDLSHFPSLGFEIWRSDARTRAWPRINQKWRRQ